MRPCVRPSLASSLVGTIQATVFARSLSNFTCRFLMMRGATLLILGHVAIGQGHILLSVFILLYFIFIIRRRLDIRLISCCLILCILHCNHHIYINFLINIV